MTAATKTIECDLVVIGTGMAGLSAALFAAENNLETVLVGRIGGMMFASGLLDMLGVYPVMSGRIRKNPLTAMAELVRAQPEHPYTRLSVGLVEQAASAAIRFLNANGLEYQGRSGHNQSLVTSVGSIKTTWAAPAAMAAGAQALDEKKPCLVVSFKQLKEFSAGQIAQSLAGEWPGLRSLNVDFPGGSTVTEVFTGEIMARALEMEDNLAELAGEIKPHLADAEYVGLPGVLGLEKHGETVARLAKMLERPVFEIPTMPVSVPGLRLMNAYKNGLSALGVQMFTQHRVFEWEQLDRGFLFSAGTNEPEFQINCRGAVLASGRFMSKGLTADRKAVYENLFGLPVQNLPNRNVRHSRDIFDPAGHRLNRAGIGIDSLFRPVDRKNRPCLPDLYVAGSILAGQDWVREKSGSGLSMSTALGAVRAFMSGE